MKSTVHIMKSLPVLGKESGSMYKLYIYIYDTYIFAYFLVLIFAHPVFCHGFLHSKILFLSIVLLLQEKFVLCPDFCW